LPPTTLGATYVRWLDVNHVTPDTRIPVQYINDPELAYVLQRYRECHDFYHTITGLPVWREGEVALKLFEFANLGLPIAGMAVAAVWGLKPRERERFWEYYGQWAVRAGLKAGSLAGKTTTGSGPGSLIGVFWEEELENEIEDVRRRWNIEVPRDLREWRREERERRKLDAEKTEPGQTLSR
jgi:ubiquinone biosynthesis protein COQ4